MRNCVEYGVVLLSSFTHPSNNSNLEDTVLVHLVSYEEGGDRKGVRCVVVFPTWSCIYVRKCRVIIYPISYWGVALVL
jgi:hypothetical protein